MINIRYTDCVLYGTDMCTPINEKGKNYGS